MTSLIRVLAAIAFAICLALPGVGSDGGENGGGTGVWVLPRATCLTPPIGAAPRDQKTVPIQADLQMQMSAEVGVACATFIDDTSGVPMALSVTGSLVTIPATLMQSLAGLSSPSGTIVIADAMQVGYVIQIVVHSNGTATIRVQ